MKFLNRLLLCGFCLALLTGLTGCPNQVRRGRKVQLKLRPSKTQLSTRDIASFFKLDVGDVIKISVYKEPNLSREYTIYPSCEIEYPMIRIVKVCGRTPGEVRKEIARRLFKEYFRERPTVSLSVKEFNSKQIHVIGEVSKPGRFRFVTGLNVLTAIANAGGFTKKAARNGTKLIRRDKTYLIPLGALGTKNVQIPSLQPGDLIYVPESFF
jgi:polysaccharide export outer membrane protein